MMGTNTSNATFFVQQDLLDKANKALAKAKSVEQKKIRQGWRWVKISKLSKILVPCDKNGEPTTEGQRRIDELRNKVNIIL